LALDFDKTFPTVKTRKRILFMIPTLTGGGAERVMVTILRHLDRSRFAPALAVVDTRNAVFIDEVPADVELIDLRCTRIRYAFPTLLKLIWRRRPDVVFSTLGQLNLALAIMKPILPRGVRYLARETIVVTADAQTKKWPRLWKSAHELYRRFDGVICQSRDMQNDLVDNLGVPRHKTTVIHNPVDLARIRQLASAPLAAMDAPPEGATSLRLVSAGRLTYQKGFDMLIDAVARCTRSVHLTILGEGPLRRELEERARAKGVSDRVRFAGFLKNPYPFFAQSDAFVLSSRYEGFPNVVLEALACGAPVIALPAPGGVREILEPIAGCVIAKQITTDSLVQAIEQFPGKTSLDAGAMDR
jgi:glycosyltransferase involved in cell wall biosynthesis